MFDPNKSRECDQIIKRILAKRGLGKERERLTKLHKQMINTAAQEKLIAKSNQRAMESIKKIEGLLDDNRTRH